jgi:hypothetical protein
MKRPATMSGIARALLVATFTLGLSLTTTALADEASKPVAGNVLVVLAKQEAGEIDAKLKSVKALQKAPFNAFKSMKVLSTTKVQIDDDKPATVKLPNGRTLQIKLVERMKDGRHKVQVAINREKAKDYLPLLTVIASKEPFFVAGQKYEGGTLVIGVSIGPGAK